MMSSRSSTLSTGQMRADAALGTNTLLRRLTELRQYLADQFFLAQNGLARRWRPSAMLLDSMALERGLQNPRQVCALLVCERQLQLRHGRPSFSIEDTASS